jgi:hypothetical protein
VGVGEGVKVRVGIGEGVIVSGGTAEVGTAAGPDTGEDWQAARLKKNNRQRHCFMDGLYQRSTGLKLISLL